MVALTANLSGTVTDAATTLGISGVTVSIVNAAGVEVVSTLTAADGTYAAVLATGTYTVTFTNGAAVQVKDLTVLGTDPAGAIVLDASF